MGTSILMLLVLYVVYQIGSLRGFREGIITACEAIAEEEYV